ncbi:MAG: polysaccharide biosynthesis/export family protein [Verrucomicrobia bacterium]|nr:polysaccharide biosynthesis/export family protein [Verrucomicrobiota bacterium]
MLEVDAVAVAPSERLAESVPFIATTVVGPLSQTGNVRVRGDLLQGGDRVQITVFEEPELSGVFPVSGAGTVDYPMLGQVPLGNLTLPAAARLLHRLLGDGYLKDPLVSVSRAPSLHSGVHILGAVLAPGTYGPDSPGAHMTLAQLLRASGGLLEQASTQGVMLIRQDPKGMVAYPVHPSCLSSQKAIAETIELQVGDIITVPWQIEPSPPLP